MSTTTHSDFLTALLAYSKSCPVHNSPFYVKWSRATKRILNHGRFRIGQNDSGKALAQELGWDFFDADDFHPPGNIAKMTAGIPLSDSDRGPWLAALHHQLLSTLRADRHPVLACSALKEAYRAQLLEGLEGMGIIYLKGSYDLLWRRISTREEHYMKPQMLQSQFDILEEPKDAVVLDVEMPVKDMIDTITIDFEEGF